MRSLKSRKRGLIGQHIPSRHSVKHDVAKLVKSFGRLSDAAESLDDFRYTKSGSLENITIIDR